jgi:type II secretory pathway pseudopilin PulG
VPTRRGFAIVDAVVAGVLLGVALSIIMGLTGSAIASQTRGEELQTAAMLADERLNLVLAVGPEEYPSVFESRGRCDAPFQRYAYEVTIAPGAEDEPFLVRAEISWSSAGRPRSVAIETLMAPRRGDEPDPEREPDETVERES